MASYEAKIAGYSVTINHVQGGTNQMGVKKSSRVKAWAMCPVSNKRIEEAANSLGEATRACENSVAASVEAAQAQPVEA